MRSWKRRVWTKVEASLWVIGAAFFLWRGDGIYNLPDVVRLDDNVDRCHPCCMNLTVYSRNVDTRDDWLNRIMACISDLISLRRSSVPQHPFQY